jgi:hypothetical protein
MSDFLVQLVTIKNYLKSSDYQHIKVALQDIYFNCSEKFNIFNAKASCGVWHDWQSICKDGVK